MKNLYMYMYNVLYVGVPDGTNKSVGVEEKGAMWAYSVNPTVAGESCLDS